MPKSLSDFPSYNESPYKLKGARKVNSDELSKSKSIDKRPHIKLFYESLNIDLNKEGYRLFRYILIHLKPGDNCIVLNSKDVVVFFEYKTNRSYYQGLMELLSKDFLSRSVGKGKFFINVNYFYKY